MTQQHPSEPQEFQPEAILLELRRQLRSREQQPKNIEASQEPVSLPEAGKEDEGLLRHVQELQARWVVTRQTFTSRVPLAGGLITRLRSLWNQLSIRLYLQPGLQQQEDFNASVVRMAQYLLVLEDELAAVLLESADYDRTNGVFPRRLAQIETTLQNLTANVTALQREQNAQSNQEERLKRLERRLQGAQPLASEKPTQMTKVPATATSSAPGIDYFAFEQRFRGTPERIKDGQRPYVDYFASDRLVMDLGCGRGEFLELLHEASIPAKGVDSDADMVAYCQEKGLDVEQSDLFTFLAAQENDSLGGVFTAQVIEHLPPPKLLELLHLSYLKLAPGGVLLAETINPMCLLALASHFTKDLSHEKPVHPDTAAFLAESIGYTDVQVRFTSPIPERGRLQPIEPPTEGVGEPWRHVFNENVRKLNDLLFTYQDYALIARKPS